VGHMRPAGLELETAGIRQTNRSSNTIFAETKMQQNGVSVGFMMMAYGDLSNCFLFLSQESDIRKKTRERYLTFVDLGSISSMCLMHVQTNSVIMITVITNSRL
jgi:hypothetical protein